MQSHQFEILKSYVGFEDADIQNILELAEAARTLIPRVVDRFYEVVRKHPEARAVFVEGDAQIERQGEILARWLRELFSGDYDQAYYDSRFRIGAAHVRVGLPQRFMPLATAVVREELGQGLIECDVPDIEAKLVSLDKLLTLDLTIMLESYKESYSSRIRDFERKTVQAELAKAQHLAEIGQLAASLAHEIKNPLAGISGAIQIIGESFDGESPYKPIVRDILAQIARLDATVKDLLLYARPTPPERRMVKLSELVPRLISVLHEEPALRNVDVRYHGTVEAVSVDERQLEQLLINLILNAAHASEDGASIDVEAVERDAVLAIRVRDYGCGMPPEERERAMEPFFTTKAKGTGLGLAICRRIAESHGGTIKITSQDEEGTTVTVELPRQGGSATMEQA